MKMTEAEFQRIYRYVKLHYGIDMSKKKEIMTGRLENYVVAHGYASYDAFMNALETDPTGHMEKRLIGMLTTNHTFFMREFEHMEYLSRVVLPELSQKRGKDKRSGNLVCGGIQWRRTLYVSYADQGLFRSGSCKLGYNDSGNGCIH